MRVIVVALSAALAWAGAASAASESDADPCYEPAKDEERWLDWAHRELGTRACATGRWFDGFFGDQRFDDEVRKTHGRLSLTLSSIEREGVDLTPRFRLRLHLPNLSKRLNVFVGRDDEGRVVEGRQTGAETLITETQRGEDAVGVGYSLWERVQQRFALKAGVRGKLSRGLNPFVQVQYRGNLWTSEKRYVRLTETAFWRRDERFGLTSALDFEGALSESYLLRWGNAATMAEGTHRLGWQSTLTLFKHLGHGRAIAYELSADRASSGEISHPAYGARLSYRRAVMREWLLGEFFLGTRWQRADNAESYEADARLGVALEALFGAKP